MLEWVTGAATSARAYANAGPVGILLSSAVMIGITISGATPGLQIYNGPNGPRWISSRAADGLQPFFWVLLVAAVRASQVPLRLPRADRLRVLRREPGAVRARRQLSCQGCAWLRVAAVLMTAQRSTPACRLSLAAVAIRKQQCDPVDKSAAAAFVRHIGSRPR